MSELLWFVGTLAAFPVGFCCALGAVHWWEYWQEERERRREERGGERE